MSDGGESSNRGPCVSAVNDYGARRSHCGYCKAAGETSISHGMWAFDLTVDDYQELLDRGWRRSGCFLYKPDMERTCCPPYTIRAKASDFVASKQQTRVLKKMRRYLDGKTELEKAKKLQVETNLQIQKHSTNQSHNISSFGADVSELQKQPNKELHLEGKYICYFSDRIDDAIHAFIESQQLPSNIQLPKAIVKRVKNHVKRKLLDASDDLVFSCSISFQFAATLRRLNLTSENARNENREFLPNDIAEKLASFMNQSGELFGFSVKSCKGHLNFHSPSGCFDSVKENASNVDDGHCHFKVTDDSTYGHKHHEGPVKKHKEHKLEIRMKKSCFDPEEYALYRKYQIRVHDDKPEKVTESSYKRFLVDSPLIFQCAQSNGRERPHCGFGSFHQQYLIDDKLVAVGVIDILPKCLSSKYLFWDPDFSFLSLGKYSALMEINWVREAEFNCPTLQYYYLGYYIHSCSKMSYKAAYHPSELLCPVRYQWVPFHVAKPLLNRKAFVVLSDIASVQDIESYSQTCADLTTDGPCKDPAGKDCEEYYSDEDEEMELDFEYGCSNYYSEFDSEIEGTSLSGVKTSDISKVVLGVNGSQFPLKDLERVLGPVRKEALQMLELQLHKFVSVVGDKLSGRIVYKLD